MSGEQCSLIFFVNGIKIMESAPDPEWTLLHYLRNTLKLTGTKLGCGEGGCGACTVMISKYDRSSGNITHIAVNACLAPLCSMHGLAVTTVEGIGSTKKRLHPVQERLAKSHGSQCGFCTPGIVMSMYTLLRNNPKPSLSDIERSFQGNLCRCTGYRPILSGFASFANVDQGQSQKAKCPMGEECCQAQPNHESDPDEETILANNSTRRSTTVDETLLPYDPTQEPTFPCELQLNTTLDSTSLCFRSERITWYRPCKLDELLFLKSEHPEARLVVGNTEVGIELKFKNAHCPVMVAATHISELTSVTQNEDGICFGGSVTLTKIETTLKRVASELPEDRCRVMAGVVEMLRWFAGRQIRNVSAVAGNIMTASPISDLNPLWMASGCMLNVISRDRGIRRIKMDAGFFQGYRKTSLKPDEILLNITIPYTKPNEYFYCYKQAQRRNDDIAIVNAGMKVVIEPESDVIQELCLCYGGMGPTTVVAQKTMDGLVGETWDDTLIHKACPLLAKDLPLPPGVPGGSESYRSSLSTSFFFKFYLYVLQKLHALKLVEHGVSESCKSAIPAYDQKPRCGAQVFEEVTDQPEHDAVGRPITHVSASKQATGEARYCDDIPKYEKELYLALVTSTKAHATLSSVDAVEALAMEGVVDFISHRDISGSNITGHIVDDEEIFATTELTCQGQILGAILADSQFTAQRAANHVKVDYDELPAIISIEQAIEAESFFGEPLSLTNGDLELGFSNSDDILEGEVRIGGQEHFYLECQSCLAVPKGEDDEMEVFSSTQSPTQTQMMIAKALGVQASRISCRTKRIGGGFGGKQSRSTLLALPVAIAAHKHNRPVRCMLDREEDMALTGARHPFLGRYKVGCTRKGEVLALELHLYSNCGNSLDLSEPVMVKAMLQSSNCYRIPNIKLLGFLCKTNVPSNTAFRAFGAPQGLFVCETWINHIAEHLKLCPDQVRELNMYTEGDKTHFNQTLDNLTIQRCWLEVKAQSDYRRRLEDVNAFNIHNRWKKRGIALIPTQFGIAFTELFLNQAGALVHIYTDGSVLLTHAGVEMGQGLHTKIIQIASRALGVPIDKIFISETCTNTVPNTYATAASVGSDINGMAVMNACHTLRQRLKPYMDADPNGEWEGWVSAAYFDRTSLSATGFYRTPDIGFNFEKLEGRAYSYYTCGAACSEVEIDCLTGDHTVLRTDIVMDVGRSLNPVIDIGQIEGGFIQGYGLFTLEELRYSPDGALLTRGPGTYKIPGFSDIPVEFNVALLKGSSNPKAIYTSKGVGEPPLFLSASVLFAIKHAIISARKDAGVEDIFTLDSPATSEIIRLLCEDQFTKQFPQPEPGTHTPWSVQL